MSRVNIWKRSYDDEGEPLPYRNREVAPVPLHVSQDFPEEHIDEMDSALDEWDQVMRDVVRDPRAWECRDEGGSKEDCLAEAEDTLEPDVLVLCPNNPVKAGDNPACGPPGTVARLGDLRYHFLDWITEDIPQAPAAVTWWSADLETGENINTHIKLTGGRVVRAAAFFRDAVLLAQDRPMPRPTYSLAAAEQPDLGYWSQRVRGQARPFPVADGAEVAVDFAPPGQVELEVADPALPPLAETPTAYLSREALLAPMVGTSIEGAILDPEDRLVRDLLPDAPTSGPAAVDWELSPLRQGYRDIGRLPAKTRDWYGQRGVDMEIPFEIDIHYYSKLFEGLSPEEIYDEFKSRNVRNFFLHELGHMLGMRHNFAGSFDAINYRDEYWELRREGCVGQPRYVEGCELTLEEAEAGTNQYAYSSVLDYMPRLVSSDPGLSYYDNAAIYALYAKMVPVFTDDTLADDEEAVQLLEGLYGRAFVGFPLYWEEDPDAPYGFRPKSWHYTRFPEILGDLSAREYVPSRHLDESTGKRTDVFGRFTVPFLSCEDSTRGVEPYCMFFDSGADPYEIAQTYTSWFRTYYPLNNFRRGRLDWFPDATLEDVTDRVFTPVKV